MELKELLDKWKKFVSRMNDRGVPLPMVRYRGQASASFTLVVLSSFLVIIGLVGKWSEALGDIDMGNAMQFFYASCTLFFGNSFARKKTDVDINIKEPDPKTDNIDPDEVK